MSENGKQNCRIEIQERFAGQLPGGQPITDWIKVAKAWANFKGLTGLGTIKVAGDVPDSIARCSWRIRYRRGITAGMRVLYLNEVYDIVEVQIDMGRKKWTYLVCTKGISDG